MSHNIASVRKRSNLKPGVLGFEIPEKQGADISPNSGSVCLKKA